MSRQKSQNLTMIHKILDESRNEEIRNLNRIKFHQEKKIASVNRLISYKNEYDMKDKDAILSVVPALLINKLEFIKKLEKAIEIEKHQVELFEHEKITSISKIDNLDIKIKAINELLRKNELLIKTREEEISISDENELAIQKLLREKS